MRSLNFAMRWVLLAALSIGVCSANTLPNPIPPTIQTRPTGATETAVWQHHKELINYYGVTASFTCTGIEDKLRTVLLYFGARKQGLKVTPMCSEQLAPMHQVFVRVEFDSLTPTGSAAGGASGDQVNGEWADLHVTPRDPLFRDRGECELFEHLKDLLTKNFTVRDVQYRTTCTPHSTTLQDYNITGQVLLPPDQARVANSHQ
jgi:hypothetical protein